MSSTPTERSQKADAAAAALKAQGNNLFREEKYEEALVKYLEATSLDPSVAPYWSNAAACYEKLKKYSPMEEAAKKCLDIDPTSLKGYYRLAFAQQQKGRYSSAIETAKRGLEISPNNTDLQMLCLTSKELSQLYKCANCGNENAPHQCARCSYTCYCSKECQVANWKAHKPSCQNILKTNLGHKPTCQNCFKELPDNNRNVCAGCHYAHYCSKSCARSHWKHHRTDCENTKMTMAQVQANNTTNYMTLLKEWKDKKRSIVTLASTLALTKKQFLAQSHAVILHVEFDYNMRTFRPMAMPEAVAVEDLEDVLRKPTEKKLAEYTHVPKSEEHKDAKMVVTILDVRETFRMTSLMPEALTPNTYQHYSWDEINVLFKNESCLLETRQTPSWGPLLQENLKMQVRAISASNSVWTGFLAYAYRVPTTKPRNMTHVLVVSFELGFGMGEITELVKYHFVSREEAEERVNHHPAALNSLNVENGSGLQQSRRLRPRNMLLPSLFVGLHSPNLVYLEPTLYDPDCHDLGSRTVEQCDKKASQLFRLLREASFKLPEVSSPDLKDLKMRSTTG